MSTLLSLILIAASASFTACNSAPDKASETEQVQTEAPATQETVQPDAIAKDIDLDEFEQLIATRQPLILDVRTPEEFAEGAVPNAVNLDVLQASFKTEIGAYDTSEPVIVYCRSGARSANAMSMMHKMGFKEVYNLKGGYLNYSANKK